MQGLFGVALAQVEVEAELLHDGYLVCFDEFDEVAVRILDVGEVSARITHGERLGIALLLAGTVGGERVSHALAFLFQGADIAHIETYLYEAWVAPVAAFVYAAGCAVECLRQLDV